MRTKRNIIVTGLALVSVIAMAGCSVAGNNPPASSNSPSDTGTGAAAAPSTSQWIAPPKAGPYKVGLANGFNGNSWRQQMVAEFQYACDNQYKAQISQCTAVDANSDDSTQIQQINDFVTQGYDIILIDPTSATAENAAIDAARQAGVQVVTFDSSSSETSQSAIMVGEDQKQIGTLSGQWLASQLQSGDTIVDLTGIDGNPISQDRDSGAVAALQAAGIQIVASAPTNWDYATAQTAFTTLLAAHPDIKGVYSQGGDASRAAIDVMAQQGMSKILPIPGEASNGFLKVWQQYNQSQGFTSFAFASPPELVVTALGYAIGALQGTDPGQAPTIDIPTITQDTLANNVKPDVSDSLWLPTTLPDSEIQKLFPS
ncbi:MAG: substrate-binding domain-containing protein [Propionibacteriaceae bacterium]|nr:substrate-binding domain-containing protein [Propionibacteriaceae bacterium]